MKAIRFLFSLTGSGQDRRQVQAQPGPAYDEALMAGWVPAVEGGASVASREPETPTAPAATVSLLQRYYLHQEC
jgi:hypothetical protein